MSLIDNARLGYGQTKFEKLKEGPDLTAVAGDDKAAIAKLAEEFESIFTEIMLKSMRDSVHKSELIDGGNGEDVFRSMLDSEYAKTMAGQRRSGIADAIERHLIGLAEEQTKNVRAIEGQRAYGLSVKRPD